jgi:hypothetical protein
VLHAGLGARAPRVSGRIISLRPPGAGRARGAVYNAGIVALFRSLRLVAFDAASVSAAVMAPSLRGPRLRGLEVVPLAPGAILPLALSPNLSRPEEVSAALERLRPRLGSDRVTLVLPDGLARVLLLEAPRGAEPREYARFRLGPALPYPLAEAAVDVLPLDGRRFLAAAVRREVVAGYEAAAAAAGLVPERADLAPLAALSGLLRQPRPASVVEIVLGDAALSLAAFDRGRLCAFRSRRRDPGPGEAARVGAEATRTAVVGGVDGPCFRVTGPGARGFRDGLAAAGHQAEVVVALPWVDPLPEAEERPWLGAAVA